MLYGTDQLPVTADAVLLFGYYEFGKKAYIGIIDVCKRRFSEFLGFGAFWRCNAL
jgi:hypothetical protein